jgi:hypothetical protein
MKERREGHVYFESTPCCLGVEEIDTRNEAEIEDSPNDVELPMQILDADGRNLDDL